MTARRLDDTSPAQLSEATRQQAWSEARAACRRFADLNAAAAAAAGLRHYPTAERIQFELNQDESGWYAHLATVRAGEATGPAPGFGGNGPGEALSNRYRGRA